MTEPTNPLFEDEKDFLERKKLEYERALRGDVAELKETTVQAGKVAIIGAGVVGGIWLLAKAFSGGKSKKKKHKPKKHRPAFEDYAGFDGFDENDQEWTELADDFQAPDYAYDPDNSGSAGDGFYFEAPASEDDDDNGLGDYPDFPAHSTAQHGNEDADAYHFGEDHGDSEGPEGSFADTDSYQARPYDDSRRLPHSNSFAGAEADEDEELTANTSAKAKSKRSTILPMLTAFAQSETGRVIVAQAAAVALALVTKAVQGFMPKDEAETGKNADLAASSAPAGVQPATWPATSATSAAQNASAAAHHDDTLIPREPLA
ncbi:hypothetical protein QMK33_13665 [Hymenobacter sp. H14-R3]|uniref:hypothetical protein n=1 Tax=Hymenobacter sp. H14-R3 TaxID=3046308 RepID=UPI0024BB867D|nr:hypothetical protein [Hymenobacter sp. H14-R3]MDJ0366201.1 hypothetical protein [Hymenobacter sp. H14-R3]